MHRSCHPAKNPEGAFHSYAFLSFTGLSTLLCSQLGCKSLVQKQHHQSHKNSMEAIMQQSPTVSQYVTVTEECKISIGMHNHDIPYATVQVHGCTMEMLHAP